MNTIGISKLLYLATILPVPKWVISEVNNLIWPFLWGCRMETVSRQSCHQPFLYHKIQVILKKQGDHTKANTSGEEAQKETMGLIDIGLPQSKK